MSPSQRNKFFAVLALGGTLRALAIGQAFLHHPPAWFFAQSSELAVLGNSLNLGHGFASPFGAPSGPSAFLAPGYPALVALLFRLFGSYSAGAELAVMTLQAFFGIAAGALLMHIAQRLFSGRAYIIAGLLWALSPTLIFFPTLFWESSLSFLLLTALLAVVIKAVARPAASAWTVLFTLIVLVFYINPSLLPTTLALLFWTAFRNHARPRTGLTASGLVAIALMSLWPLRNERQLHAFIPMRSNLGYELWQGNRPGADGFFDPALHPNNNAVERNHLAQLGEVAYMSEKGTLAKQAIAANPTRFLALTAKRFVCFWTGVESHSSGLIILWTVLSTLFGFAGLGRLWKQDRALAMLFTLPLLLFPLPYIITHPDFRFRAILDPVMLLLAAFVLSQSHLNAGARTHADV